MTTYRVGVDIDYTTTISNVLSLIERHAGKIVDHVADGPAGGNPYVMISFNDVEHARSFLHEYDDSMGVMSIIDDEGKRVRQNYDELIKRVD